MHCIIKGFMEILHLSETLPPSPYIVTLCNDLDYLKDILQKRKINIPSTSELGVKQFLSLPIQVQNRITKNIQDYVEIIMETEPDLSNEKSPLETELKCLEGALTRFGLKPLDDISSYLTKGDVIEIYNKEGVQLYRNFEFFKNCSYSLMDVITNEWFILYERPQQSINAMFGQAALVVEQGKQTIPWVVPEHIMKERYLNAKRAFKIKCKYISPLTDKTGKSVAVLTTMQAELISEGDEVTKINMI
jgi:hypothetical protein